MCQVLASVKMQNYLHLQSKWRQLEVWGGTKAFRFEQTPEAARAVRVSGEGWPVQTFQQGGCWLR